MDILDTNIFVISIYDSGYAKAVTKFINENEESLPYSLCNEINNQLLMLLLSFQKIYSDLNEGISVKDIYEFDTLKKDYNNIYNVLENISDNFKNLKALLKFIEKKIGVLLTLQSWSEQIKSYPPEEKTEKHILKKYKPQIDKLKRIPELHYADLKIIVILHHQYHKTKNKASFITRDKNLLKRKIEIEKEFTSIELLSVNKYLSK